MSPDANSNSPILIAYDGSNFAKAAIDEVARQFGSGRPVLILTVWEPFEAIPFLGVGGVGANQDAVDAIVTDSEKGASKVAEEGAKRARDAGLDASALVESGAPAWQRIVKAAEEQDASLVVIGSRGHSGLGYVLLGSVATAVAQHSKRPVLIAHQRD
jgi:nucleotide-binding universal stress UspA family protein